MLWLFPEQLIFWNLPHRKACEVQLFFFLFNVNFVLQEGYLSGKTAVLASAGIVNLLHNSSYIAVWICDQNSNNLVFLLLQSYYNFQQAPVCLSHPQYMKELICLKPVEYLFAIAKKSEIITEQQVPRETENFSGKKTSTSIYSYESSLA